MEPTAKSSLLRGAVARLMLFGVLALLLRFIYVIAVSGGSCSTGDFCVLPYPDGIPIPGTGGASSVRITGHESAPTPALRDLWTSREWRKAVDFYSAVFQDLIAEGFLSPTSASLCVDTPAGNEVFALKEIGVPDAIGVHKKKSAPLVVSGDLLRQPFGNSTFDFIFAGGSIERSKRPLDLALEITRILKPKGFIVVHTASCGDLYSLHSFLDLFPSCKKVRSREIDGPGSPAKLREIVLQKEDGTKILSHKGKEAEYANPPPGGNSVNKCSIPEHKLQLLQSAEPLIKEEPLKPWITLKKNINNIKYLPSIADISFKQRYVYIDVGSRSYGSSIGSWFKKQYPKQNRTFEIYAIEADRAFHHEYAAKKGVNLLPFAAWVRNESLSFEVNSGPDKENEQKGRGMGRIRPAGPSSGGVSSGDVHTIRGFDFAGWLKSTVSEKDYVVMKMDVEGTEFDLVPRLFETGAICLVDELFLECHYNRWQRCCPGERSPKYQNTYGQCLDLVSSLRASGVLVHQWW